MHSITIEKDIFPVKVFVVVMVLFSVIYFYLLRNYLALIVPLSFAAFAYWGYLSTPLEYFWASNQGIEFHVTKNEITLISWVKIKDIYLDRDISNDNAEMIVFELHDKLEKKPLYIGFDNWLKPTLHLKLGKRNKKIFNELSLLKKQAYQ